MCSSDLPPMLPSQALVEASERISTQQAREASVSSASGSETPDDDDTPLHPFPKKTAAPTQKKTAALDTESEAEEPSSSAKTSKKKK